VFEPGLVRRALVLRTLPVTGRGEDMATVGAMRRIDQLGRVVVPAELRKMLGFNEGDVLEFSARGGELVLRRMEPSCAICGSGAGELVDLRDKHLCHDCVHEIRLQPA
jgi:transcriptional pleiotropic regulator of transition state genes